ncbi:alpha/beta hydrolase [Parvibaculaceae bacterium PLY_AMNH_Bact1]|nr:alpha/beta hydrolase [Parvibaculaceae bacterium PLY_AMNH_Bact1]
MAQQELPSWRPQVNAASLRARFWIGLVQTVNKLLRKSVGAEGAEKKPFDVVAARKRVKFLENIIAMVPSNVTFTEETGAPVAGPWVQMDASTPERTLLYVHGGSFILERSGVHDALIANICNQANASAFVLDYRLAPENPFPAGIEDVKAAYRWLIDQGAVPENLGVVADSAGGGLALAALIALRDEGVAMPGAMVLLGPWVDMTLSGNSILSNLENDPMVSSLEGLNMCSRLYLQGHAPTDPLASPLFADLTDLPPTLIHVGAPEILRDDSTRLATRLREAGVQAWCDVYPRMPHVWHRLGPLLPETKRSIKEIGDFLCEMLPGRREDKRRVG